MRIRRRLAFYGAFVIGSAMFAFALLLNLLVTRGAPQDQQESLTTLASDTSRTVTSLSSTELRDSSPVFPVDLTTSLEPYVAVYTEDGSALFSTGRIEGAALRLPAAVVVEALDVGESLATVRPSSMVELAVAARQASLADGTVVVVVAGQSAEFVEQQIVGLRVVIWAASIITLIGATVASWLVSGRALRPLRDLVETTEDIRTTGDLSRRLPPVDTDDEVGKLAVSFNAMLDRVESSQEQLSEALAGQKRFVADASHELRSPLTTIRANAGFLRDRTDVAEPDRREAVADISTQADRMSRLVDDLLLLASVDGGARAVWSIVDVSAAVEDVWRRMERSGRPIAVTSADTALVDGDPDALGRLVWTLVENADKHGSRPISVDVTSGERAVTIRVADSGPGFPAGDLHRVFERFYRADPARSPAGSGLGLAIAREIAESHGGTIVARNRDEGGAEVKVTLPTG